MICISFATSAEDGRTAEVSPEVQAALRDLLERGLRDDNAFPVLSDIKGDKLRINVKIGPVEAVFEEDLEATFEQLLDPVSDVPRTEVADLLEDLVRRIRQAELDRNGPAEEGPET